MICCWMNVIFPAMIDIRPLTSQEVERVRLILSTFQDGTGMLALKGSPTTITLPGWRDFERAVALALGGTPQESKAIFDVLVAVPNQATYGISCKMRRELDKVTKHGRVSMELTNSAGKFWGALAAHNLNQQNYKNHPAEVGAALLKLVTDWHTEASQTSSPPLDLNRSFYLTLSWNKTGDYQLHQFPIYLPDPQTIYWRFPSTGNQVSRRLEGRDAQGVVLEWYGESGGQLKYYPPVSAAVWASPRFRLEPLPPVTYGLTAKAAAYFPNLWSATL